MLIHPRGKDRPYHLGPFPLETLRRDESVARARGAARRRVAGRRNPCRRGRWRAPPRTTARCSRSSPRGRWRRSRRRCPTTSPAAPPTSRARPISSTPPRSASAACRPMAGSPAATACPTTSPSSSWSSARGCRSPAIWRANGSRRRAPRSPTCARPRSRSASPAISAPWALPRARISPA